MSERVRALFHRRYPHRSWFHAEEPETVTHVNGSRLYHSRERSADTVRSSTERSTDTVHSSSLESESATETTWSEIYRPDSVTTHHASSFSRHEEPTAATDSLESIESETENLLSERIVARAAHLDEVKDLVNANHSCVVEAFEEEAKAEWLIQEQSPLYASHLVEQSRERTQSMLASKQTLEKIHIPLYMIPRVDDALENEKQLVVTVSKTARDAGEQQKQLRDIERKSYQAFLALIEKQHMERMELSKRFQEEKESHLKQWASSRANTLEFAQSIEQNSQHLVETLNVLAETMKSEVLSLPSPRKSECQVCYDDIEGPSSARTGTTRLRGAVKQRSCLIPCNHAMICLPCATEIWESTKSCPFCKVTLATKPLALYLG